MSLFPRHDVAMDLWPVREKEARSGSGLGFAHCHHEVRIPNETIKVACIGSG